ncbi:MAG: hydrogenase maturation protease [Candidatus Aegiribacteria sp.]|nr:hydrogenase maturation protease [Candidatus Aegiribacteria sp.]MBD3294904.1 hydrogenase maturation protease [Candidatus Fermentibacteria bacterium]
MSRTNSHDSTLILGLGNPILGDDGIGCLVADRLKADFKTEDNIEVISASVSPLRMVDEIAGKERLIIIDSASTGSLEPGTLFEIEPSRKRPAPATTHSFSLDQLQEIGASLGLSMPRYVKMYGIEIVPPREYTSTLSPGIKTKIPELVREIASREMDDRPSEHSNNSARGETTV